MTVPANHYRVQYTFSLGADGEVAVTGFTARTQAPDSTFTIPVLANLVASQADAAWHAGWDARTSDFPSSVSLLTTKAYHVVDSGPSDGIGAFITGSGGTAHWAGAWTDSVPWEVASCITLEAMPAGSRVAHPRRYRGRMYLPPLGLASVAGTAGLIATGVVNPFLAAAHTMFEAYNDVLGPTGTQTRAVVLSRTGGFSTDITHVSMDNQFDLQKRRQNRQAGIVRTQGAALRA